MIIYRRTHNSSQGNENLLGYLNNVATLTLKVRNLII